ncbi:MAG: ATPase [Chlorobi bacterium]|nr:ATPase [Chlorobiota bacterium]
MQIEIRKKSGEKALFDPDKLRQSLERSGANPGDIETILKQVEEKIYDGISTHKLYQMAYAILRKISNYAAGRYRLKKAILQLGPTGYPFERFVGELLRHQGFEAEVGQIVQGNCVQHEVDVVAKKGDTKHMIECKFHSDTSRKSDVKVALYIHSRFLDVKKQWEKSPDENIKNYKGWVVTNTRFTEDAMQYGKCAGLNLLSWDYPQHRSLRQIVDEIGLHPITALQSLTVKEKQEILKTDVVLCRNITKEVLENAGIKGRRINAILKEARELSDL